MTEEEKQKNRELAAQRRGALGEWLSGLGGLVAPFRGGEEEVIAQAPPIPALHPSNIQPQTFNPLAQTAPEIMGQEFEARQLQAEQERIALEEQAAKDRIWATYPEDVGSKKDKYLSTLEEIQGKARQLNMIAGLTGGTSQASSFTANALEQLDKIMDFDDKERLQQIGYALNWTKDGTYDPPKTRKEAQERAIKLGASPTEASTLAGYTPEQKQFVNWRNTDPTSEYYMRTLSTPLGQGVTSDQATIPGIEDSQGWVRTGGIGEDEVDAEEQFRMDFDQAISAEDKIDIAKKMIINQQRTRGKSISEQDALQQAVEYVMGSTDLIVPDRSTRVDSVQEEMELKAMNPTAEMYWDDGQLKVFEVELPEGGVPPADLNDGELNRKWRREWDSELSMIKSLNLDSATNTAARVRAYSVEFNKAYRQREGTPNFEESRAQLEMMASAGIWIPKTLRFKYNIDLKQDQEESLLQAIGDSLPKWMGGDR